MQSGGNLENNVTNIIFPKTKFVFDDTKTFNTGDDMLDAHALLGDEAIGGA